MCSHVKNNNCEFFFHVLGGMLRHSLFFMEIGNVIMEIGNVINKI